MTLKWYLGVLCFSLSLLSILLNLLVFIPVFRLAFLAKKSSIYVIAFFNVLSDLMQLSVVCFYLSTSIIADDYVISGGPETHLSLIFGWIFLNAWYMDCLIQIVMAVNRCTVIIWNNHKIFTYNFTMFLFLFLCSFTVISSFCTQYVFPCCTFILDHSVLSVTLVKIDGIYSYSNLLIVTYDIFCTSISTICYIAVFRFIKKSVKKLNSSKKQIKQVRYLVQFVFISIFYIVTWVLFEILPHIVPAGQIEWYCLVPVFISLNCASNPIIYLSVNAEVRNSLRICCHCDKIEQPKVFSVQLNSVKVLDNS